MLPLGEKATYKDIIVKKEYPIGNIIINRPEKRNALTTQAGGTCQQLAQAYQEMADDPEVRVFIVEGAGDCFCAGFDMSTYDEGYWKPRESGWAKGLEKEVWAALSMGNPNNPESQFPASMWGPQLWDNPKPSVAKVRSFCYGAGLWMINHMDVVYATPDAIFAYPPIRYGASIVIDILPPWLLGLRKTMEMCLTGKSITAEEACNAGLITKIVPEDKIDDEVRKLAESIAKVPPMTNFFSKLTVHQYYEKLGIRESQLFGLLTCLMTEQSALPGHYWDFFDLVRKHGFREGYKLQRDKWGYPDEAMDREVERLRTKREGGKK